jgi:predicted RNA-binding Zn ribbon-like protein
MGCGCKKKTNENVQTTEGQATATVVSNDQTTQQEQTQEQIVQVAVALREMIENKEL